VHPDLEHGKSAKKCFCRYDTTGKMEPTNEPELLQSLIVCKKSINLHIKLWVESYDDMVEGVDFYMNLFQGTPPPWVEDSFRKQLSRQMMRQWKQQHL